MLSAGMEDVSPNEDLPSVAHPACRMVFSYLPTLGIGDLFFTKSLLEFSDQLPPGSGSVDFPESSSNRPLR
jgi:hypothetical protein